MYRRETRVLLRHYLAQGVGKSELDEATEATTSRMIATAARIA